MQLFIRKPSIDLYPGVKVTWDTVLEFESENVKQEIRDLVFHSVTRVRGENFESTYDTTIQLSEDDILIFEAEGRGYVKPAYEELMTVAEAIGELENIKDLGGETNVSD